LELLDEKWIKAIEHHKVYHAKLQRAFGKKIKIKEFKVGDLVFKEYINKIIANDETKWKFEPNWLGPYVVIDSTGSSAYRLSTLDGKEESKTFNFIYLKHFYIWVAQTHALQLIQISYRAINIFIFSQIQG